MSGWNMHSIQQISNIYLNKHGVHNECNPIQNSADANQ